jgi:hypothetical protein
MPTPSQMLLRDIDRQSHSKRPTRIRDESTTVTTQTPAIDAIAIQINIYRI